MFFRETGNADPGQHTAPRPSSCCLYHFTANEQSLGQHRPTWMEGDCQAYAQALLEHPQLGHLPGWATLPLTLFVLFSPKPWTRKR